MFYACFYVSLRHPAVRKSYAALYEASLELVEGTVAECMAAGLIGGDDAHELAVTVKALEEGYAFLIGGGADEAAKAEIGGALKKRARAAARPPRLVLTAAAFAAASSGRTGACPARRRRSSAPSRAGR